MRGGAGGRTWRKPLPGWWVFTKGTWFVFFLREVTCVFVAYFSILFLLFARSVAAGPGAEVAFVAWLRRPAVQAFHCLVFVAVVWHTITWFFAAPKAMRPRIRGRTIPPAAILAGHYAAWLVLSVVLFAILS